MGIKLLLAIIAACLFTTLQAQKQVKPDVLVYKNTYIIGSQDSKNEIIAKAAHVIPTDNQYEALKDEFIGFVSFGPNTFTKLEWGSGKEDPKIFDLKHLDTDQWCAAIKSAGMKKVIFTAKHHDGFVLWQSRYTDHGIMSTGFKNGHGDILKDLSLSCKKYGLKLGIYLSPADLFQIEDKNGLYGNMSSFKNRTIPSQVNERPFKDKRQFQYRVDDYNEYFLNQLFELLTEYGPIYEVWFDGAHPKTKGGQRYNYAAWRDLITRLAPQAIIFGKEDVRWCGNESGMTRDTEWNIIPFDANPGEMEVFKDLTDEDLGSREKLYRAKYLHYQQAETNTSIREGWFYRDDLYQKVRSADDIFDIYERAVGGNSTFSLNIPPNREGRFSNEDVNVLAKVGQRIRDGYQKNLLNDSDVDKVLIDQDEKTAKEWKEGDLDLIMSLPKKIKFNRFVIQESIQTRGERIERHALDVWSEGQWKQVAMGTNVGYKRILRFPFQETDRIRLRILNSRANPTLVGIGAYNIPNRPPSLEIARNAEGKIVIMPIKSEFLWKPHHEDILKNMNSNFKIYYSEDGSTPSHSSKEYISEFESTSKFIKAVAIDNEGEQSVIAAKELGIPKVKWSLISVSSSMEGKNGQAIFDESADSYWQSDTTGINQYVVIDLGTSYSIAAFSYTPQRRHAEGMLQSGNISFSEDGKNWDKVENFEFGNLINDPTTRTYRLKNVKSGRFIKIASTFIAGGGKSLAIAELDVLTK